MRSRNKHAAHAAMAVAAAVASGCIHTKRTEVIDEARLPVEFESESAGRVFYEALSNRPARPGHAEQVTRVELPLVFSDERRVVRGAAAAFNHAVKECDTNGDRRITEAEARIWAGAK